MTIVTAKEEMFSPSNADILCTKQVEQKIKDARTAFRAHHGGSTTQCKSFPEFRIFWFGGVGGDSGFRLQHVTSRYPLTVDLK